MNRGLTYAIAISISISIPYVGVERRKFDAHWRPRLTALPQGSAPIFDRRELAALSITWA